ncbi:encapsulating protein for peroxidase [Nitrosomonas nitrosa]|uniref:encapsulin n=1 Tax=Nitrosomonas nitrosa TaxID=52442 RepID=UPI000D2FCF7D|nr:encapsulin [Nitrosomonas nitrosa]PTQ91461.1 encapsulating protein for peroxidase [Nitrosomonas nitrosa]
MSTSEVNWEASVWKEINDAVVMEMGKVRTAQKVFPTILLDNNPTEIPNDVINFTDLSIKEGQTKQFVEIYHEFPLTATQVTKEAMNKTCKTLARMAAKAIALAEDAVIFQGQQAKLPANVKVDAIDSASDGLLGEANPKDANNDDPNKVSEPIEVKSQAGSKPGVLYGENTFAAVAEGIARLTAKAQAPKFALFLPVKAYADAFVPPSDASLVTTAERIKPLVEGGFIETVTLPKDRGLLVALAGDPTSLYVGREATTEFVRKEGSKYFFRVVERIQFVARDPRGFVLLKFEQPAATTSTSRKTS